MANDYYDKDSLANLLLWEDNIRVGQQLRAKFPPLILPHNGIYCCQGYNDYCEACGTKLYVKFGDFSRPLAEHWVDCPVSKGNGHGVWASAINVCVN